VDNAEAIDPAWVESAAIVGLTAGASTPESLVQQAIERLQGLGFASVRDLTTATEHITFPLPRELRGTEGERPIAEMREPS
jgi:4-hydroxy-3-methylbut-2-enyl diphosphate reductase